MSFPFLSVPHKALALEGLLRQDYQLGLQVPHLKPLCYRFASHSTWAMQRDWHPGWNAANQELKIKTASQNPNSC